MSDSQVTSKFKTAKYILSDCLEKILYLADQEDCKEISYELGGFIGYCKLAINICALAENRLLGREIKVMQECIRSSNHKNIDYLLRLTRAKNLQISLYLTNANAIIKDIKILLDNALILRATRIAY